MGSIICQHPSHFVSLMSEVKVEVEIRGSRWII